MNTEKNLSSRLAQYCDAAVKGFDQISERRKLPLDALAQYILSSIQAGGSIDLTFICTHNSRRSHMAQLWALAAVAYYGIDNVQSYSGGTEATAFNKSAIKAMEGAGFQITKTQDGSNPVFEVLLSQNSKSHKMWSKKYDDPLNPSKNFAAVMVCSDADQNCSFVPGATRIAMPFDDPKAFDGTPSEFDKYAERCLQIATEILYVMNQVKNAQ
jgi:arsenate reductase